MVSGSTSTSPLAAVCRRLTGRFNLSTDHPSAKGDGLTKWRSDDGQGYRLITAVRSARHRLASGGTAASLVSGTYDLYDPARYLNHISALTSVTNKFFSPGKTLKEREDITGLQAKHVMPAGTGRAELMRRTRAGSTCGSGERPALWLITAADSQEGVAY